MTEMERLLWNFASGVRNVAACDVVPSREHMREKKLDELEAAIKELGAVLQKRVIKNPPSEKRGTKKK